MHFVLVIVYPDVSFSDDMTTDAVWDGTRLSRTIQETNHTNLKRTNHPLFSLSHLVGKYSLNFYFRVLWLSMF